MANFLTKIYTLEHPDTGEIVYVGKTSTSLKQRLASHICSSKKSNYKIGSWIKSLNKEPIINLIDEIPTSEWEFWEKHYISLFKSWNFKLKNMTDGGELDNTGKKLPHSEETKKKIGLRRSGKLHNEISKSKMSEFRKGKSYEDLYGIEKAKEIKEKLSELRKGELNSMYGKSHNDTTKKIISLKNRKYNG